MQKRPDSNYRSDDDTISSRSLNTRKIIPEANFWRLKAKQTLDKAKPKKISWRRILEDK